MKHIGLGTLVALAGLAAATSSHAGLVFTHEAPGVQATTVPGTMVTEDFNSGSPGAFSGSVLGGLGTLSAGGAKVAPDAFGGSFGSQYYAVGVQSGATVATLGFSSPQKYVGMWWPAGDGQNRLAFYNGATLLGSYRVGDIIPSLTPAYYGNPNSPGVNTGEPYVYLNFTATGGDQISQVDFLNDSTGSGFEIDNISVTDRQITPPGVPDGGSTAALLSGTFAAVYTVSRRLRK